jgi:hypothetical protein
MLRNIDAVIITSIPYVRIYSEISATSSIKNRLQQPRTAIMLSSLGPILHTVFLIYFVGL